MYLIYKSFLVIGTVISALYTSDYAYYLWRMKQRKQAVVIGLVNGIGVVMAICLMQSSK